MPPLVRRARGLACHPHEVERDPKCRADVQEEVAMPRRLMAEPVAEVGRVGRIGCPGGDGSGGPAASSAWGVVMKVVHK
jgi:hypothetical protein